MIATHELFLLLLLGLVKIGEASHYKKCRSIKTKSIRCDRDNLGSVPQNFPPSIELLVIKDDDLTDSFSFPVMPNLKKLTLQNVKIGTIPERAFQSLRALEYLHITNQREEGELSLADGAFHGMFSLKQIRLYKTGLVNLPDYLFRDSALLTKIYITNNAISTINADTFKPLTKVQQLNLMHNYITDVADGAFECVDRSFREPRLYLSNNRLRNIPSDIALDTNIRLYIHDNPLVCDCNLLVPHNFADHRAECAAPDQMKQTKLLQLVGRSAPCSVECAVPQVVNGYADHENALVPGELLRIRCYPSYNLNVMPRVTCQEDGTFGNATIPECEEEMNDPEVLEDGSVRVTSSEFSEYPNFVTIACPTRTYLKSCRCVELQCQGVIMDDRSCRVYAARKTPTKGQITCISEEVVLEQYTYHFSELFQHRAACTNFHKLVACSNYIPTLAQVTNHGELFPDEKGICSVDCGNFECDMGIRCISMKEKKSCDPFSIKMGTVTLNGEELTASTTFLEGDTVTITCHEGYELWEEEENTVECVEGDKYLPEMLPDCYEERAECTVEQVEHVEVSPGWTVEEGQSIYLTCSTGYQGTPITMECRGGGIIQPAIECNESVPAECYVENVPHATVYLGNEQLNSFYITEGDKVRILCEDGFSGSATLICLNSGNLNQTLPSCTDNSSGDDTAAEDNKCTVPRLRNGVILEHEPGDVIEAGVSISLQCNHGYKLVDTSYRQLTCISSQYFEPNQLPTCRKYTPKCVVPVLDSGYYVGYQPGIKILEGERLRPKCYDRFELEGPEELVCEEDETYGGNINNCIEQKFNCDIPTIRHGFVEIDDVFKPLSSYPMLCNEGYWTGYNSYTNITCINGPDNYDPPEIPECQLPLYGCAKVAFPYMKPLSNWPNRGEKVEVECLEGYILVGSNVLTCNPMFAYIGKLPKCQPSNICETPIIEKGDTMPNASYVDDGTYVIVTCNEGYGIYGDKEIYCEGGKWSGLITPQCRPSRELDAECIHPMIEHGFFLTQSYISPGSTLDLKCDPGYGPAGDIDQAMCVTKAVFEPTLLPECERQEVTGCSVPEILAGRVVPEGDISIGQTVRVLCDENATLRGPSDNLECGVDGFFTSEVPVCEKNTTKCLVPEDKNSLIVPTQPIKHGDTFLINCIEGFQMEDGSTVLTLRCNDGNLSPEAPQCSEKPAPCKLPDIENGYMFSDSSIQSQGDESDIAPNKRAVVVCNNSKKKLIHHYVTCLGNNTWEPPIPKCESYCEMPTIENGVITPKMEQVPLWTSLTIKCDEGYMQPANSRALMCVKEKNDAAAKYNMAVPQCIKSVYNCKIPVIANGNYNGPRPLNTNDRFTIECHDGYAIVGMAGVMSCYKEEIYSNNLPYCRLQDGDTTSCKQPVIQNAEIGGSNLTGRYIRVICEEGYSIEGVSKLRCLSTGEYDQRFPQCVKKPPTTDLICGQRHLQTTETPIDPDWVTDNVDIDTGSGHQRIYGGEEAQPGEYPWNVIITLNQGRFCGGSIIGREWVLTAGHCLLKQHFGLCNNRKLGEECKLLIPEKVESIKAGVHNKDNNDNWQIRTAVQLIIHPYFAYQQKYIDYDLGLIKVSEPFQYNKKVNRVCLPAEGVTNIINNDHLHVSGWGKTDTLETSPTLQKITVPFVKRERCNSNMSYKGVITETMFCAGYQAGKIDACKGDSGGPLVYLGSNGTFVQGGIVSWGISCAAEHFYGVYTNVGYFYRWIVDIMNEN